MSDPNYEGYWKCLGDLNQRQLSNSETYDKALLTLSSAFLGLSLTFIKDVVALEFAQRLCLLYIALTIITVIASFIYGQSVIDELKVGAKSYFIDGEKIENTRSVVLSERLHIINSASGIFFIVAVIFLTVFVSSNIR